MVRNLIRVCVHPVGRFADGEARSARRQVMPARETEAIILKTFPLGEADRLVSFLGRTSGRLRGVAFRRSAYQKPLRLDAGDPFARPVVVRRAGDARPGQDSAVRIAGVL